MSEIQPNTNITEVDGQPHEFELSLQEIAKIAARRWKGIVLIIVLALLFAFIFHKRQTPEYHANSVLLINSKHAVGSGNLELPYIDQGASIATDVSLIQSSSISEEVVKELNSSSRRDSLEFFGKRHYIPPIFRMVNSALNPDDRAFASDEVQKPQPVNLSPKALFFYTQEMQQRIRVTPVSGTNLLNVSVSSPFPDESVFLTNTLCEVYKKADITLSSERYSRARNYLIELLKEQQIKVDAADNAMMDYMRGSDVFEESADQTGISGKIATFDAQYNAVIVDLRMAKNSLDFLETKLSESDKALSTRIAQNVNSQIGAIQDQIKASESAVLLLLREKKSDDPEVQAKQHELDLFKARYAELSRSKIAGAISYVGRTQKYRFDLVAEKLQIERKLNELKFSASELLRQKQYFEGKISKVPKKQQIYMRLKSQQETVGKTYALLAQKLEEISMLLASEVGKVSLIGPAVFPSTPEKPDFTKNMLAGLLSGLALAFMYAFVAEILDDTIKDESFFKDIGLPMLSLIPIVTQDGKSSFSGEGITREVRRLYRKGQKQFDQAFPSVRKVRPPEVKAPDLPMPRITDSLSSIFAESFRSLRTSLDYSRIDTPLKSILVTGTAMSEGKSTICSNLGMAYALTGKRTLIVDCDLRRTSQHKKLNGKKEPGLTDYLYSSSHTIDESFFQPTHMSNLFLLSAGKKVPNPNELLGSAKMLELLKELEGKFDMVLFDSPPLFLSDAAQLARSVDGTILAVRLKYTSRKPLKMYVADSFLRSLTLGIVAIAPRHSARYGYGKYGYGKYGYGRYGYGRYGYGRYGYGKYEEEA